MGQTIIMGELHRERVELDPEEFSWAKHRTPGLHQSDIIRDIMLATGQAKVRQGWSEEQSKAAWLQGHLWEDIFTERLQYKLKESRGGIIGIDTPNYLHIPEIAVALKTKNAFFIDPLKPEVPKGYMIVSLDGVRIQPFRLLEVKWTTKSVNMQLQRDKPEWIYQVLGYLHALSILMGEVRQVERHVQFACGDYQGSGPIYEKWTETYSGMEIADNWQMLSCHAEDRVQMGSANGSPHPWSQWI